MKPILIASFLLVAVRLFAGDRLVMVAPFDNLTEIHRHIEYDVDTGARAGNSRKQYRVDRYSHAGREFLEDIVARVPGLRPVERAQFDRVMIEVSGAVRDGAIDPEKLQQVALRLGADQILMGSILDLRQSTSEYVGYTRIRDTIYSAELRVRLIDLTKDKSTGKPTAAILFSQIVEGRCVHSDTDYLKVGIGDPYFAAMRDALRRLGQDPQFGARLRQTGALPATAPQVPVVFDIAPTNSSVFVQAQGGWRYLGGSPVTTKLPTGLPVAIRIQKSGFAAWETIIEPETGLKVTHELEPGEREKGSE